MSEFRYNRALGLFGIVLSVLLASCSVKKAVHEKDAGLEKDGAPENYDRDWRTIADAVPKQEPFSRYGNPDSYQVFGKGYRVLDSNTGFTQKGYASWYGTKFHGQRTSSGETYDMFAMTAAHKSLRIPTYVEVTNLRNKRKAIVKVNDRGPFHEGRVIDLSYAAATKLGVAEAGTAPVTIRVIDINPHEEKIPETVVVRKTSVETPVIAGAVETAVEELAVDKFYVQVAAFSSEENAMRMLNALKEKKFNSVRIHVENVQDKFLYRVRIGPVPTRLIAEKLVMQLKEINHNNVRIVATN